MSTSPAPLVKASPLSVGFCNASIVLYTLWLLIPAAQTAGGAIAGVLIVGLFGLGLLLDTAYLKAHWTDLLLRIAAAAALPLILRFLLHRGTDNFWGYYVQQGMFWYPLLYCGYARGRGDPRLWRFAKAALLLALALTTLTTTFWLVQGMLRGGKVYAYSRSLGNAEPGREAYLKELMLRNIGGYDFIYASMLSLPLTCYAIIRAHGWKRVGFAVFCFAQLIMIALSQYTYALIFAVIILCIQVLAALLRWLVRKIRKRPISVLASMLWVLPLFLGVYLVRVPLVSLAVSLCQQAGLANFAISLSQLLGTMTGQAADVLTRLDYYHLALQGVAQSPLIGALPTMDAPLSQHSDLLDLLSAIGVLGATAFFFLVWRMGRRTLRGLGQSAVKPHLLLQYAALLAFTLLGTVTYSRDISLVLCLGALLILEGERLSMAQQQPQ